MQFMIPLLQGPKKRGRSWSQYQQSDGGGLEEVEPESPREDCYNEEEEEEKYIHDDSSDDPLNLVETVINRFDEHGEKSTVRVKKEVDEDNTTQEIEERRQNPEEMQVDDGQAQEGNSGSYPKRPLLFDWKKMTSLGLEQMKNTMESRKNTEEDVVQSVRQRLPSDSDEVQPYEPQTRFNRWQNKRRRRFDNPREQQNRQFMRSRLPPPKPCLSDFQPGYERQSSRDQRQMAPDLQTNDNQFSFERQPGGSDDQSAFDRQSVQENEFQPRKRMRPGRFELRGSSEASCSGGEKQSPQCSCQDSPDAQFLLSLKPDLEQMDARQKRRFKKEIFVLLDSVLDETNNSALPSSSTNRYGNRRYAKYY